jgi:hypothetical protein
LAFTKKGFKDIQAHMRQRAAAWSAYHLQEAPKRKKLQKELRAALDPICFTTEVLPQADWTHQVYAPQLFGMGAGHLHVGFAHFACIEARLLTSGSECVLGFPYEVVPGKTLREKRQHLYQSTAETLKGLLATSGFVVKHDNTSLLMLPTGFLYVMRSEGVRWSISADRADRERVKSAMDAMLTSFPELKNASLGMQQWLDFLRAE